MFEKEGFVENCHAALKEHDPHSAIRELVSKAVGRPSEMFVFSESQSVPVVETSRQ